jgi:RNA polymerase sigma-70 factor (ECF subfamily)
MSAAVPSARQTDKALMLRIRDNDPDAFSELYDRYARLALRVAASVCRDAGHAEQAVQEGFLSIWRSRAGYRPGSGSVKGWALSVVRNRAIDAVRREAAASRVPVVDFDASVSDSGSPSPQDAVVARSEADALRASMARLPDTQAEVITLAFFGGLTHSEIAEQLSLPPGTVKGRMRLGMHKLRSDMEQRDAARPQNARLHPPGAPGSA